MKTNNKMVLKWLASGLFILVIASTSDAWAQRGRGGGGRGGGGGRSMGGGARPSMGHVGGGGGRPMGGGGRPSMPMNRPNPGGGMNRPSMGNAQRPSMPSRPSTGFHPGGGGMANRPGSPSGGLTNRPGGAGGGVANRPSVKPPSNLRPSTRPTLPGGGGLAGNNRPNLGNGNRPTLPGNGNRPNIGDGNRPSTLPGIANRPNIGDGNRPTTLPGTGTRPGAGGGGIERPGFGNLRPDNGLPGNGNRPGIGNGGGINIGNRPGIGNGGINAGIGNGNINIGNRPGIGNGNINIGNDINIGSGNRIGNNNIGNRVGDYSRLGNNYLGNRIGDGYIGNRPGWDLPGAGWNRPGWGIGAPGIGWAGNWHNNCIHPNWGFYNGCWGGGSYWGSGFYRPFAWGAVGWGLGSWTSGWGYGGGYSNPYYSDAGVVQSSPYDYSQPVVVNNYASSDAEAGGATADAQPAVAPSASEEATKIFNEGLAQFKSGAYKEALGKFDAALKLLPGDAVVHEVRALTLFALGEYTAAAASLNSLLSSAPGMDWTTMSGLYGNAADYTAQLRKLESYCIGHPTEAAPYFVLAYHYLVTGEKDNAINSLKVVVKNQPQDFTAKRMLDALVPPEATPQAAANPLAAAAPPDENGPTTDLVGTWKAKAGLSNIELVVTADSKFTWKAGEAGKSPVQLSGQLNAGGDAIELATQEQGSMEGSVKSLGPDKWQFNLQGAPAGDPGLTFERVKS